MLPPNGSRTRSRGLAERKENGRRLIQKRPGFLHIPTRARKPRFYDGHAIQLDIFSPGIGGVWPYSGSVECLLLRLRGLSENQLLKFPGGS